MKCFEIVSFSKGMCIGMMGHLELAFKSALSF